MKSLMECMLLKEQVISGLQGETLISEEELKTVSVCYSDSEKAYAFINKKVGWWAAQKICRQLGGELLTPRTQADLKVISQFANIHGSIWVNATDIASEGSWFALDGMPITATSWRYGDRPF